MAKCNQATCANEGTNRFTWPGRDEAVICDDCLPKLRGVANAMGLHLQVQPLIPVLVIRDHVLGPDDVPALATPGRTGSIKP